MPHTLARLNAATADDAASMLAGLYLGAPGSRPALDERPFATLAQLSRPCAALSTARAARCWRR